jgi:hypothetical protein
MASASIQLPVEQSQAVALSAPTVQSVPAAPARSTQMLKGCIEVPRSVLTPSGIVSESKKHNLLYNSA